MTKELQDSRAVLWDNVTALMQERYGREHLTKLAKDAKFGPGTSTRIKNQETSIGLETIDKLAQAFNLVPWQLLMPDLGKMAPGVGLIQWWPFTEELREAVAAMGENERRRAENAIRAQVDLPAIPPASSKQGAG